MPDLTPADELRTAASSLRAAAISAPPCQHPGCGCCEGWHKEDADGMTVCTGCDYDAHRYISPGYPMPDTMGPLLAEWLESVGSDIGDHSECIGKARCELASALRIARAINAKTEEQP